MDPQLQQEIHEPPPQSQTLKLRKISTLLVFVARGSLQKYTKCLHQQNKFSAPTKILSFPCLTWSTNFVKLKKTVHLWNSHNRQKRASDSS
jgi:hypothetical protein